MIRSQTYCFLTLYIFFCIFPLPNTFASPTASLCRRDQRDVLFEIQKEFHVPTTLRIKKINGPAIPWNKSIDCCSWEGVTCDTILGEVISLQLIYVATGNNSLKPTSSLFNLQHLRNLDLSFGRLHGEIPSSIKNLSHLTSLDLSWNYLQGEIPSSIGNLSRLTSLDLSCNYLQGEIPSSIGNLSRLTSLDLSINKLRGNIPTSFANLTELSVLNLRGNQFTGGDIVLANLTSLKSIGLSSNHFKPSIFPYLSGLHKLEEFSGNDNSFVGPFPSSLLMIPSLVKIDLSQNQFEGPIDFGNTSSSSNLEDLYLSHNNFGGQIPRSLSKLVNLRYLDLSHNNFGVGVPRSLSKLVNLTSLDLSYNRLEGQVPYCLWKSPKLHYVFLSHNSLSSLGKSVEIADGSSLWKLDLGSNSLQGPFPQWICNSRDLSFLDISNNHFTGLIPQCLKNFTSLQKLNLRNNNLSGFLPDLCIDGSPLQSLDVSRNNLVGKLPKSLTNCTKMRFLNVRENKIEDMFPFWLGSLQFLMVLLLRSNAFYGSVYNSFAYIGFPSLSIIDISNNNFVGSLPQDYFANWSAAISIVSLPRAFNMWSGDDDLAYNYMGDFSGLGVFDSMDLVYKGVDTDFSRIILDFKAIDFSRNRFSGHIPESLGLFSQLRLLNLSGNTFTGNIPPSLANITNLETLDLSGNNLSGEIPQGLGKLTFLSNINFSHNHLEGLVPRSTQFRTQNCSSFMGNPGLYGLEEICKERHHVPIPTSQQPKQSLSEAEERVLNWITAAIAFGPGVFCGLVIGHIFTSYKHEWFIAR